VADGFDDLNIKLIVAGDERPKPLSTKLYIIALRRRK